MICHIVFGLPRARVAIGEGFGALVTIDGGGSHVVVGRSISCEEQVGSRRSTIISRKAGTIEHESWDRKKETR